MEEYIIIAGYNDTGSVISPDILQKLFSIKGTETLYQIEETQLLQLETIKKDLISDISTQALERNGKYFDETITKLDKWAEDKKYSLEVQLKEIKKEIAAKKIESRKIADLDTKLQIQRQIKNLETKQKDLRRKLFDAEDEIDREKETLIG